MVNTSLVDEFWQAYCATVADENPGAQPDLIDQFGDHPALADELGALVLAGTKTATCSALWEWEAEASEPPQVGTKTLVLNGAGQPICIIETTEVQILRFNQVDAQFAYDEGEDDRTLESWRREHWKYFSRALPKIGKQPTENMLLVCERFNVIYPPAYSVRSRDPRSECRSDRAPDPAAIPPPARSPS
ncbi:ASCH domain-containing protein [filamentous cyanobacterium CCP5]|nr:ASCH domain-containing protein [filamentous cyanobacterium CCP5]